jgi:hypothetical protein
MLWEVVCRFYAEKNCHGAAGRTLTHMLIDMVNQNQIPRLTKFEHSILCLLSIYVGDTTIYMYSEGVMTSVNFMCRG